MSMKHASNVPCQSFWNGTLARWTGGTHLFLAYVKNVNNTVPTCSVTRALGGGAQIVRWTFSVHHRSSRRSNAKMSFPDLRKMTPEELVDFGAPYLPMPYKSAGKVDRCHDCCGGYGPCFVNEREEQLCITCFIGLIMDKCVKDMEEWDIECERVCSICPGKGEEYRNGDKVFCLHCALDVLCSPPVKSAAKR